MALKPSSPEDKSRGQSSSRNGSSETCTDSSGGHHDYQQRPHPKPPRSTPQAPKRIKRLRTQSSKPLSKHSSGQQGGLQQGLLERRPSSGLDSPSKRHRSDAELNSQDSMGQADAAAPARAAGAEASVRPAEGSARPAAAKQMDRPAEVGAAQGSGYPFQSRPTANRDVQDDALAPAETPRGVLHRPVASRLPWMGGPPTLGGYPFSSLQPGTAAGTAGPRDVRDWPSAPSRYSASLEQCPTPLPTFKATLKPGGAATPRSRPLAPPPDDKPRGWPSQMG